MPTPIISIFMGKKGVLDMLGLPPISRVIAARLVSTIAPNRAIVVQVLDGVAIDVLKHILHLP